jgi:hypothetical protein
MSFKKPTTKAEKERLRVSNNRRLQRYSPLITELPTLVASQDALNYVESGNGTCNSKKAEDRAVKLAEAQAFWSGKRVLNTLQKDTPLGTCRYVTAKSRRRVWQQRSYVPVHDPSLPDISVRHPHPFLAYIDRDEGGSGYYSCGMLKIEEGQPD